LRFVAMQAAHGAEQIRKAVQISGLLDMRAVDDRRKPKNFCIPLAMT